MRLAFLWLLTVTLGLPPGPGPRTLGSLTDLVQRLNVRMKMPAERLELLTDHRRYAPGQRLWVEALLYQPWSLRPVPWGAFLHLQLRDRNDSLCVHALLRRDLSAGAGYLDLPVDLAPGPYRLVVYSDFMQNQPGNSYQALPVWIGPQSSLSGSPAGNRAGYRDSLALRPEGGALVNGFESRVYYRSLDRSGAPLGFDALLLDDRSQVLDSVRGPSCGLGYFVLSPEAGRSYRLEGRYSDGSPLKVALPAPGPRGYALRLQPQASGALQLTVVPGDSLYGRGLHSYVLVQSGDSVTYAAEGVDAYRLRIRGESLRPGLSRVLLVGTDWQLLESRLVYRPYRARLQLRPQGALASTLLLTDAAGRPLAGRGYLSWEARAQKAAAPLVEPLWLRLLRREGLRGTVASSYRSLGLAQAPDSLLLDAFVQTQPWAALDWQQLLHTPQGPLRFAPDTSQYLTGLVTDSRGAGVAGARLSLIERAPQSLVLQTVSDARGRFVFAPLRIQEGSLWMLSAVPAKGHRPLSLRLEDSLGMDGPRFPLGLRPWRAASLASFSRKMRDMESYSATRHPGIPIVRLPELRKQASQQPSAMSRGYVVTHRQLAAFTDLVQALSVVPGVNASYSPDGAIHIRIHNAFSNSGPADPLLVLDGVPMNGLSMLGNFTPDAIDSMVVLRGSDASIYGVRGGYGAILLFTRKQEGRVLNSQGAPLHWAASGYETPRLPLAVDSGSAARNLWLGGLRWTAASGGILVPLPVRGAGTGLLQLNVLGDQGQVCSFEWTAKSPDTDSPGKP